jgi:hypothetical protein
MFFLELKFFYLFFFLSFFLSIMIPFILFYFSFFLLLLLLFCYLSNIYIEIEYNTTKIKLYLKINFCYKLLYIFDEIERCKILHLLPLHLHLHIYLYLSFLIQFSIFKSDLSMFIINIKFFIVL